MYRHSPVTFDLPNMTLGVRKITGEQITFIDESLPTSPCTPILQDMEHILDDMLSGALMWMQPVQIDTAPITVHKLAIANILDNFKDVFAEPNGLPPQRDCDHAINLDPGAPVINQREYRLPHHQKNALEEIIKELLQKGIIRLSHSPYSSPAILVKKKDMTWRLCIDYRRLNALNIKNKYPIPMIEDLLDELNGATIFTKIDLRSGYHQIRMKEGDIEKTAFSTHLGLFEFLVMPFGVTNGPPTFQQLMHTILAPLLRHCVLVFFDDILIFSKTYKEHLEHVALVLETLRKHQLYAKLSKCTFAQSKVEYLGYVITDKGVSTDPAKVEAIVSWPTPQNVTHLRSFLGLARYYRRFIQNYGLICKPLFGALKKEGFRWTDTQATAFQQLKDKMTTAPVLALPDFSLPFVLEADASGYGIGAVLMQKGQPIAFLSKALGPKAAGWSTYDKEALAIIEAIKKWKHYFASSSIIIRTDQQSLKHIQDQKVTEGVQHKLLIKLLGYKFTVEYKKGKENRVTDALSKVKYALHALGTSAAIPTWITEVVNSYKDDTKCSDLITQLAIDPTGHPPYTLASGVLRYKGKIVIGNNNELRNSLLTSFHTSELGGHSGERATYHRLKILFTWPEMRKAVQYLFNNVLFVN